MMSSNYMHPASEGMYYVEAVSGDDNCQIFLGHFEAHFVSHIISMSVGDFYFKIEVCEHYEKDSRRRPYGPTAGEFKYNII